MYQTVELGVSDRLSQSKEIISHISSLELLEPEAQNSKLMKIQKGYLFVSLYSSIEYTVTSVVSRYLEILKQGQLKPMEYQRYLLCAVLDSNFKAIDGSGKKKVWDKKKDFFDSLFSSEPVPIDESVFPTDGSNISHKQIEDVWGIFNIEGEPIPEGINTWALNEIKDNRNAIAHGREKAADVGGRYTAAILNQRVTDVETLCFHIVAGFKESSSTEAYRYAGIA